MFGEAAVADGLEPAEGVGRLQAQGLRRVGVIRPSCSPGCLDCTSWCMQVPWKRRKMQDFANFLVTEYRNSLLYNINYHQSKNVFGHP
jgi:hypothetical protein